MHLIQIHTERSCYLQASSDLLQNLKTQSLSPTISFPPCCEGEKNEFINKILEQHLTCSEPTINVRFDDTDDEDEETKDDKCRGRKNRTPSCLWGSSSLLFRARVVWQGGQNVNHSIQ